MPPPTVFAALRHRNFRLFIVGQFVSLCGTWMQTVAQGWLVLQLTDSAFAVGLVTALGSLPILLFTLYGGVVADRVNKHRLVLVLQALMLTRGADARRPDRAHLVTVHWVMGLAVFFGLLAAFEVPTRQALIAEIVEREDLMNAIALGSSAFNVARVVGPGDRRRADRDGGARGLLLRQRGQLSRGDREPAADAARRRGRAAAAAPGAGGACAKASRYVFGNRWPRAIVIIIATFAVFGFSFMPMMPVFARDVLHLDASGLRRAGLGRRRRRGRGAPSSWPASAAAPGSARLVLGSSVLFGVVLTGRGAGAGVLVGARCCSPSPAA